MKPNQEEILKAVNDVRQASANAAYLKALYPLRGLHKAENQYLYFIQCGDAVKIGRSDDPRARLEALATGAPGKLTLLAKFPKMGNREAECHRKMSHLKIHGEWFRYTYEIEQLIGNLSREAK